MIANKIEYERAQEEIRMLEARLNRLMQNDNPGQDGFTKAGIRKLIARTHEELAIYEGELAATIPASK